MLYIIAFNWSSIFSYWF